MSKQPQGKKNPAAVRRDVEAGLARLDALSASVKFQLEETYRLALRDNPARSAELHKIHSEAQASHVELLALLAKNKHKRLKPSGPASTTCDIKDPHAALLDEVTLSSITAIEEWAREAGYAD